MLNNDDFNLLNTLFPAWQQLTTKQQQIISQNASLIQVKKNNFVHTTKEGCSGILIIKKDNCEFILYLNKVKISLFIA